jgi:hypothetical protein
VLIQKTDCKMISKVPKKIRRVKGNLVWDYNRHPSSTTLRSLSLASVLTHSDNRVYLVWATPSPKFLPAVGTSDILRTLGEIFRKINGGVKNEVFRKNK